MTARRGPIIRKVLSSKVCAQAGSASIESIERFWVVNDNGTLRIAAIENYAHAQVAVLVRRLEQRLVEAFASAARRDPRPREVEQAVLSHLAFFRGDCELADDLTLVVVRVDL